MDRVYNFSPGPAMLPLEVMRHAQQEFLDFSDGISALEVSHRQQSFLDLLDKVNNNFKTLLNLPDDYKVLWTTGGATLQFSVIPLFFSGGELQKSFADYLCTGYWSEKAAELSNKYLKINRLIDVNKASSDKELLSVPNKTDILSFRSQVKNNPLYLYYTPNETISGVRFNYTPDTSKIYHSAEMGVPLIADMTSCILSEPVDVNKYGMIFASAQKNLGPSGVTLVIIKENLLEKYKDNLILPELLNYYYLAKSNSLMNTPPTYNIYFIYLVTQWLIQLGGVDVMYKNNVSKSQKLYNYIDNSEFYSNSVAAENRSLMNVCFNFNDLDSNFNITELEQEFVNLARNHNLYNLEGHRSVGGMRASIYNGMPEAGIDKLIEFMQYFAEQHH